MKLSAIRADTTKEVEGVWVKFAYDIELRIARMHSTAFNREFRRLSRPYERLIQEQQLDDEQAERLLKQAAAKTVLLDWRGMEDEDGKQIPYSEEKALEILMDPELQEVWRFVQEESKRASLFRLESIRNAAGNSGSS